MSVHETLEQVVIDASSEGVVCSDTALALAHGALEDVAGRYGPESLHPLAYHNAEHAVDVIRRGLRLVKILDGYIPNKYKEDLPDLVVVGGATHDIVQGVASGQNESLSADDAVTRVESVNNGTWSDEQAFSGRLRAGIMATQVDIRQPNNEIVQVNLPNGEPDVLKYILAFADINGIAMDGPVQMIRDCMHLCKEIHGSNVSGHDVGQFLLSQSAFLRMRLNDRRVRSDLMYYFLEDEAAVYGVMKQEFEANIVKAVELASFIHKNPEVFDLLANELMAMGQSRY